jgi:hypothetical protein
MSSTVALTYGIAKPEEVSAVTGREMLQSWPKRTLIRALSPCAIL